MYHAGRVLQAFSNWRGLGLGQTREPRVSSGALPDRRQAARVCKPSALLADSPSSSWVLLGRTLVSIARSRVTATGLTRRVAMVTVRLLTRG